MRFPASAGAAFLLVNSHTFQHGNGQECLRTEYLFFRASDPAALVREVIASRPSLVMCETPGGLMVLDLQKLTMGNAARWVLYLPMQAVLCAIRRDLQLDLPKQGMRRPETAKQTRPRVKSDDGQRRSNLKISPSALHSN